MGMRRILVVFTTRFAPNDGATCVIMNYYRNMNLDSIHVDFASHNETDESLLDEISKKGSHYYNLKSRANVLLYFLKLYNILKNYDVLHVNGNSATSSIELLAGKLAHTKIRIAHNHNTKTDHPIIHKLLSSLFKSSYNVCLACSKEAGNWIFGEGNFKVLINAIDVNKYVFSSYTRSKYRDELLITKETVVVGHVGAFNEQKNHHKLLDVFKEFLAIHPNARLLLVGDGYLKDLIIARIKELDIVDKVILTGIRTDIPQILSVMDVFVFPSKFEGLGLAVIEAQASGLPCLLSDHVPQDVYLSEHVESLSLEVDAYTWAGRIEKLLMYNRTEQSRRNAISITQGGYNIKTEANMLYKIYKVGRV